MDNRYPPPQDPAGLRATRPFGPGGPGEAALPGQTLPGQALPGQAGTRTGHRLRWGIGIAAGTLLLCGAIATGLALTSGSRAASSSGPTGQAAVLNSVLSSASSPLSSGPDAALAATPQAGHHALAGRCRHMIFRLRAAGRPRAARAVRRACLRLLRPRPARLGGIHGQFSFNTAAGPRTLAYQRGVVESASAAAVVVRASDGTTWTWHLVASTIVREDHQRAATSALSAGQRVFAAGPVSGGSYDARLIVIRPAAGAPAAAAAPAASS